LRGVVRSARQLVTEEIMADSSSQGIAIVGAGSLGQTFAAMLAAAGKPVVLLSTSAGAHRLRKAMRIRLRGALSLDVAVGRPPADPGCIGLTDDPADLPSETGLVFATKGHQLAGAAEAVRTVWPCPGDDAAWVSGLQNGLLKDDVLAQAFGADRVVGAATITSAQRESSGEILVVGRGITYFGEFDARLSARASAAARLLSDAGLPGRATGEIHSVLWSK
jgi:2-dehydropantoate 2-reductase